jgi:hypothetical protein
VSVSDRAKSVKVPPMSKASCNIPSRFLHTVVIVNA